MVQPIRRIIGPRPYRYRSFFNGITSHEEKFKGFIVFNKPKYKPGDTVRLKAFVEKNNGRLVNRPLILRISDQSFITDTILATLHPYKPGGYVYEFVLSDSLDLDLDDDYLITLEEPGSRKYDVNNYEGDLDDDDYALKRKVLVRGKLSYEEYELQQINVSARTSKQSHSRGEEVALFLKATDENEMAVLDGRVQITVQPENYGTKEFHGAKVFLPDTLWTHEQALETLGETKIILPDSIFPAANFSYSIQCNFLNSNNELQRRELSQTFTDEIEAIAFELKGDSLFADHLVQGKSAPADALLYSYKKDYTTVEQRRVTLPVTFKVNPFAAWYTVQAGNLSKTYNFRTVTGLVSCLSSRTKDSIIIQLVNPNHLQVWYTVFAGNKVILRGVADSLLYMQKLRTKKNYFVSLQYIFNNEVRKENYTIPPRNKLLTIKVDQPETVYPGQSVPIQINVSDAGGKPAPGVDITAYGFTAKFHSRAPFIPYLGKIYPIRKQKRGITLGNNEEMERAVQLNWKRWSREMNLDTIEYYKFLHPDGIYINREPAPDSITQLAPFVVIKGELQPVQLLYIDERPVFFNQVQQQQRYSFRVPEGKHSLRIRTQNHLIRVDSVWATNGMKTFISIEADTANKNVKLQKVPAVLTPEEESLWGRYMILVTNNFGENLAYIRQNNDVFLLNGRNPGRQILAGPFTNVYANLIVKNKFRQEFEIEGSWEYTIAQGLIKQKQFNYGAALQSYLLAGTPLYNFQDFALTEKAIDSLWKDYLDNRSANIELFRNPVTGKINNGKLQIGLSAPLAQSKPFIKNIILFRYDNPDFILIYPGATRQFGYLQPGKYRMFFLLKKDAYFIRDSLTVVKDGINYYEIGNVHQKQKDSVSSKIAKIIEQQERGVIGSSYEVDQIKESFNRQYVDASTFTEFISGTITDAKGAPIPGALVIIKGTTIGVSTNAKGQFNMRAPANGIIVVSCVGFESEEYHINAGTSYNISLTAAEHRLEEVVVTGYSAVRKRSMTASVTTVEGNTLAGKVPGISIRGTNSLESTLAPLIIVDGLPYSGRMEDLDPASISATTIMTAHDGRALYGSRAAGGVIIVTTKRGALNAGTDLPLPGSSLRRNFRDNAYWQPKLISDKNGNASFNVTFPDDITNWQTYVIAMGSKKRTGYAESSIRSFKAISGNIMLPQFAVAGDSIDVIGKALNYLPDTVEVRRSFFVNDQLVNERTVRLRNSWIDTLAVVANNSDSLKFKYTVLRDNGYLDGEERSIPVFRPGVLETNGIFATLDNDTAFQLDLGHDTGTISIYAETSLLPVIYEETEKIRNYEYLCNEQLASKLKALLVQKKIDEYLGRPFKSERNIRDLVGKLNQNKSGSGLWGWWPGNEPSMWISLHVIEALLKAQQAGYEANINKTLLTDYLIYNIESYRSIDKISCLFLLKQLDAKADYKKYIDSLEKKTATLYERLRLTELKQQAGLPVALDTLLSKAQRTMFGNIYWGEENFQFFNNSIQNTLSMYRILQKAGDHDVQLKKIRNYFLEKRNPGQWRNTYESSLIMEAILPGLLAEQTSSKPLTLSIDSITSNKFPLHTELKKPGSIAVSKTGAAPVYFTAYRQHWNSDPVKVDGNFTVRSYFDNDGKTMSKLKAGQPVKLKVVVNVLADADYVLIEVPIPAGCSYQDKSQSYANGEVHREHFKNKVSIFCRLMSKGVYTFTVSLLPRFNGVYALNPAKAEMMYFPVFYGREGMRKVRVE
ncbi:MAG TPA: carboxypeptidase-like regulatory domain-containing protein [Chitinophagaceae bacterium]|nr:carboxypeptidase-like regulatory domain-containing protein [Chitinophagaceae bacterium]